MARPQRLQRDPECRQFLHDPVFPDPGAIIARLQAAQPQQGAARRLRRDCRINTCVIVAHIAQPSR